LRTTLAILTLAVLCTLAGCGNSKKGAPQKENDVPAVKLVQPQKIEHRSGEDNVLTVNFVQGQTIEYRFVAKRDITIDWDPEKKMSRAGRRAAQTDTESLDIVMAYTATEVNPYGLTTVKATCKSARVSRSKRTGGTAAKDAAEHFAGKSYTLKIGPTARIEDANELDALIKQVGQKAFRPNTTKGRIKEPDMINDFVATQWFLWDSVSSIPIAQAIEGLDPNQTWNSQLSLPSPMVMRQARDVVYKLDEIRQSENGPIAVISSTYSHAKTVPQSWPIPYAGSFQMSGTFGFLGGYNLLSVEGTGKELFNIKTGRMIQYDQRYNMKFSAIIPMGIGSKPQINIRQTITARPL